jgi:hypothetical protein
MIPDTKDGQNCAYAITYWSMSVLMKGIFPKEKAEIAAQQSINYLVRELPPEEALSYIRNFRLDESEYWKTL